jgi:hypothetical protein
MVLAVIVTLGSHGTSAVRCVYISWFNQLGMSRDNPFVIRQKRQEQIGGDEGRRFWLLLAGIAG